MTHQLETAIAAARALSLREKLELLEVISHDLQESYLLTEESSAVWNPRSIEELAASQRVQPIARLSDLAVDFWPEDETVDDFIAFTRAQRAA